MNKCRMHLTCTCYMSLALSDMRYLFESVHTYCIPPREHKFHSFIQFFSWIIIVASRYCTSMMYRNDNGRKRFIIIIMNQLNFSSSWLLFCFTFFRHFIFSLFWLTVLLIYTENYKIRLHFTSTQHIANK